MSAAPNKKIALKSLHVQRSQCWPHEAVLLGGEAVREQAPSDLVADSPGVHEVDFGEVLTC